MPIFVDKNKLCPKCRSLLKLSIKGPVCRNTVCEAFVSFEDAPMLREGDMVSQKRPSVTTPVLQKKTVKPDRCCLNASFDIRTFFKSMKYLGSVQSRANQYFCYEHNDVSMASTGIKELTRFNAVRQRDLDIIEKLINNKRDIDPFNAEELKEVCLVTFCPSNRITEIKQLERQGKNEHNELYWLMLTCCYLLTAKGKLTLEKQ